MAKPTVTYEWATENIAEYIQSPSGDTVLVLNKLEPSVASKQNGVLARQPHIRAYYNYEINAIGQHIDYLYEGEIDDSFVTYNTATTVGDVEARFGNTWTDLGTGTHFGVTARAFRRTA